MRVYRALQGCGLFDLLPVPEGSCEFLNHSFIFIVNDPRTLSLIVFVGSFGPQLTILMVIDPASSNFSELRLRYLPSLMKSFLAHFQLKLPLG